MSGIAEEEFPPSYRATRHFALPQKSGFYCCTGRIKLLRESINLVEVGLAIYTNGLADYTVPTERDEK